MPTLEILEITRKSSSNISYRSEFSGLAKFTLSLNTREEKKFTFSCSLEIDGIGQKNVQIINIEYFDYPKLPLSSLLCAEIISLSDDNKLPA